MDREGTKIFIYISYTVLDCMWFLFLFAYQDDKWGGIYTIPVLIIGPVLTRLIFESFMMFILLVKNTIDLNNKLIPQEGSVADKTNKEAVRKAEEEATRQQQQFYSQQQFAQQQYGYQPQSTQPQQNGYQNQQWGNSQPPVQ